MNKIFLLTLALSLVFNLQMFSQTYKSKITSVEINNSVRPAISIVSEAELKSLQKEWNSFLKKDFKAKTKSTKNTVNAESAIMPDISSNPINIYSIFNKNQNGTEIVLAFEMDKDNFASNTNFSDEFEKLSNLAERFVTNHCLSDLTVLLKNKEKILRKNKKREAKLIKDNKRIERAIERDITQKNINLKNIEKNKEELENLKIQISNQNSDIEQLRKRKSSIK